MSQLKVNAISDAAGANGNAITLATDGTCTTKATNKVAHNFIYNGEMQIAQRGTSSTSYGYQTVDRWKVNVSVGAFTTSQDTESPNNFSKSLKLDCTTAATASGNNNISIQQHLEGLDLQGIGAGTSDAKSLTLSFWVRSTKTGVFNTILYQKDGGKFAVQNTTISSANTWEKKTFTVAGNTADAIANDNTKSLTVEFWLDAGPDYRGGTVDGSWNTWANNEAGEGITLNLGDNTANNFWITGIQLELGDFASDYAHKSYGDELARCQRYFYMKASGNQCGIADGRFLSAAEANFMVSFPVTMRAAPSIYQVTGGDYFKLIANGYTGYVDGNWTIQYAHINGTSHYAGPDTTGSTNLAVQIFTNNSAARLGYSAEL